MENVELPLMQNASTDNVPLTHLTDDECLSYFKGYTKITSKPITLHKNIPDDNIRLIYGDYRKLIIIDSEDIPEANRGNLYLNIYNIPKTEYIDPSIRFNYYYGSYYIYPYINELSIEDMKNEPIKIISKMNYFINKKERDRRREILFVKIEKNKQSNGQSEYCLSYYINDEIILNAKKNIKTHSYQLLIHLLISQKKIDIIKENNNILSNIINFDQKQIFHDTFEEFDENLQILNQDINLYNYQKQDIMWMKTIEDNVDNGNNIIEYSYSKEYKVLDDYYLHDDILSSIKDEHIMPMAKVKYYGGNIISEVGLGKTLITLYYILQKDSILNRMNDTFATFGETCNYFYKRGKNKGTCCKKDTVNNLLYCKEHLKTPFIDKRKIILKNLNQFNFKNFITYHQNTTLTTDKIEIQVPYISTNSSLIICKNQLCDQWVQEYYTKFKNNHRILLIVTYDQYTNLTLADFLFSDIVVVSYEFLNNKRYQKDSKKHSNNLLSLYLQLYNQNDISANENLLNTKIFNYFDLFYWNRIIYDEAHEIPNTFNIDLKSKYKWNITGTPFVNKLPSFIKLMSYNTDYGQDTCNIIKNQPKNYLTNIDHFTTDNLIEMGLDKNFINDCKFLFRRNTKNSILEEYNKNIIKETTNLLEFTNQERSIYDGYVTGARSNYINFLVKLCCHPELNDDTREMIKNCKTFDEIHNCLLDYNKSQINIEDRRIKNAENDIEYYQQELNQLTSEENENENEMTMIENIRMKLNLSKRKLTIAKKNYQDISRTYNYLKNSLDNLKIKDSCPVCLDDIQDIAITKCGHKFCWDCLYKIYKIKSNSNIKCPVCNSLISNKDVYLLNENNSTISLSENAELSKIIQTVKSTKIGNIIHFLKTTLKSDDKVILFSQWDELLHKVGNILTEQNINVMYCDGSVYKRKRAIESFYNDPTINLILLSSKNSASGINLTIANKIIFLEPIYGSEEYRKNIESQAIGRADRLGQKRTIDIYRFIIKDTIEQDIYNNCIDDSKIKQLS